MKTHYSTNKDYVVQVSEADALTISVMLRNEQHRRVKDGIQELAGLADLIHTFEVIALTEPCVVCEEGTIETINVPCDGDMESGPYTIKMPCHEKCADAYFADWAEAMMP